MRCLHCLPASPALALLPAPAAGPQPELSHPFRILACVDHEDAEVMDIAAQLAASFHAALALLFVVNDISAAGPHTSYSNDDVVADRRARGRQILSHLAMHYQGTKTILREGSASVQIAAAARDWAANLIVMGTHRRGAFGAFFLGSTSFDILQHSTCPVLLVPTSLHQRRFHAYPAAPAGRDDPDLADRGSLHASLPPLSSADAPLTRSFP